MIWLTRFTRLLAALFAATLIAIIGVVVVAGNQNERAAISEAKASSTTATTVANNAKGRVTDLLHQINQLERSGERRSRQIVRLETQIGALIRQLRRHGVVPVIVVHHRTTVVTVAPKATPQHHGHRDHPPGATSAAATPAFPGHGRHRGEKKHKR